MESQNDTSQDRNEIKEEKNASVNSTRGGENFVGGGGLLYTW